MTHAARFQAPVRAALASCALALAAAAQAPPSPLVGQCSLEDGGAAQLFAELRKSEATERLMQLLDEHTLEHGWDVESAGADHSTSAHAAVCPNDVLDAIAALRNLPGGDDPCAISLQLALALDHNARVDDALQLLENARVDLLARLDSPVQRVIAPRLAGRIAGRMATLAADRGRYAKALEYARHWNSMASCGSGLDAANSQMLALRVRCWMGLNQVHTAIDAIREHVNDGRQNWVEPSLVAAWFDCEIADGRANDLDQALPRVLAQTPLDLAECVHEGARYWNLIRQPRSVQLERLDELAGWDAARAFTWLLSTGPAGIAARLGALDVVDGSLRESELAFLLARTGHPDVGPALLCADAQLASDLQYWWDEWRAANRRWIALSSAR